MQKIADVTMPAGEPLTDGEKETLYQWILDGARWPDRAGRSYVSELEVLTAISQHLSQVEKSDRKFQKYFSLTQVYNNPQISERDMRFHRAALAKAVNSMSDQSKIALPTAIDRHKTVYHIDLRDYGWEEFGVWQAVLAAYPYGLQPTNSRQLTSQYNAIRDLSSDVYFDGIPYIRGDWFVVTATRPPLYHTLAKTPETLDALLDPLDVNVEQQLRINRSRRAGLVESGVSTQNRLIEHHSSKTGTLWISYDFSPEATNSNLMRFPLGPSFDDHEFPEFAFQHSGGEVIFELPNGLHGYMLVDADGKRLDEAPINIVSDPASTSGSPQIVNGISCMHCHKHGMLPFTDSVRNANAVQDVDARYKIEEIFSPQAEMDEALRQSKHEYLRHLSRAISQALELDSSEPDQLLKFEDPISRVSHLYRKNLTLETVACELNIEDSDWLKNRLENSRLIQLGLGSLINKNGTIKRAFWEKREPTFSLLQETASELNVGVPVKN